MVKSVLSTARDRRLDPRMRGDGSGYICRATETPHVPSTPLGGLG
jgi:hypothetical protein